MTEKNLEKTLIEQLIKSKTTLASRLYREYCLFNHIEADTFVEILLNNLFLESQDYERMINDIIQSHLPRKLTTEELKKSLGRV